VDGNPDNAPPGTPADPATVFTALADILYQGADTTEVCAAICVAATLLVPGCDHASVLMRRNDDFVTVAASDRIARHVDSLERATGEGPCLDAIEDEAPQVEPDLANSRGWPQLAARVVLETPVRGAMAFRILVNDRKVGALNLFSDTPDRFDTTATERAIVLAAFASAALNAATSGENVETLRQGLQSNREIGRAVGMLMLLKDVTHEEAFDMLRRVSQEMNIKVAEVARAVVKERGELPSVKPKRQHP
jgi:transcriptional regulator with GAF, ATPase, and Fis domain